MNYEDDEIANEKLQAPADWSGPVERRICTDLLFLILIILSWVGMTAIGLYAVNNGDYRLVLYPLDFDGNVCGTDYRDRDMTEYPYLLYTNMVSGVCVKQCPSLKGVTQDNLTDVHTLITYTGVWQSEFNKSQVPSDFVAMANYSYIFEESSNTANTDTITDVSLLDTNNFQCNSDLCFPSVNITDSWTTI